jgi:hypothetical protein
LDKIIIGFENHHDLPTLTGDDRESLGWIKWSKSRLRPWKIIYLEGPHIYLLD